MLSVVVEEERLVIIEEVFVGHSGEVILEGLIFQFHDELLLVSARGSYWGYSEGQKHVRDLLGHI